jgi:hypothetical protein
MEEVGFVGGASGFVAAILPEGFLCIALFRAEALNSIA